MMMKDQEGLYLICVSLLVSIYWPGGRGRVQSAAVGW